VLAQHDGRRSALTPNEAGAVAEGAEVTERRALVITRDRDLLDDLERVAAVAGCGLDRVDGAAAGRRDWSSAPVVLLDGAAVDDCVAAGLGRRRGVLALCRGEPPPQLWRRSLELGVQEVLSLPAAEPRLVGVLADAVQDGGRPGRAIAVVGGRGGAGASVFAAALALVALRRGRRALLVDCDPLGGGTDYLLGLEQASGLRWPQLGLAGGRIAAGSLHAALPAVPAGRGRLTVLSCGRDGEPPGAGAVASVVEAGLRCGDTVVCDLPRHLPDSAVAAVDRSGLVVLVVPAEVRACSAALPVARGLLARGVPARLVVRGPAPGGLAPQDLSRALGLPLLAAMRPAPGLAAALDAGRLPFRSARSPLARAAAVVLDAVAGAEPAGGAP
jgi:secretion/DNA translocation related CpaE-like protein